MPTDVIPNAPPWIAWRSGVVVDDHIDISIPITITSGGQPLRPMRIPLTDGTKVTIELTVRNGLSDFNLVCHGDWVEPYAPIRIAGGGDASVIPITGGRVTISHTPHPAALEAMRHGLSAP